MRKIYIAAPWELRDHAIGVMDKLERRGHVVTSRWLKVMLEGGHETAVLDLADVARADILLLINTPEWLRRGSGGRHVEFGYALALGHELVVLGTRSNLFHDMNHVRFIESPEML